MPRVHLRVRFASKINKIDIGVAVSRVVISRESDAARLARQRSKSWVKRRSACADGCVLNDIPDQPENSFFYRRSCTIFPRQQSELDRLTIGALN
jgi:hypothetical protein